MCIAVGRSIRYRNYNFTIRSATDVLVLFLSKTGRFIAEEILFHFVSFYIFLITSTNFTIEPTGNVVRKLRRASYA